MVTKTKEYQFNVSRRNLSQMPSYMSHQDIKDTVLHAAVKKRDVDIAKILVECGCPVDIQNVNANFYLVFFLNVPK